MPASVLVHIPVDEFEIVHGSLKYDDLFNFMSENGKNKSIDMEVVLRTAASDETFRRKLVITNIPGITRGRRSDDKATIMGMFGGRRIVGKYHTKSRTGSFSFVG